MSSWLITTIPGRLHRISSKHNSFSRSASNEKLRMQLHKQATSYLDLLVVHRNASECHMRSGSSKAALFLNEKHIKGETDKSGAS